jgi:hypothetical protein
MCCGGRQWPAAVCGDERQGDGRKPDLTRGEQSEPPHNTTAPVAVGNPPTATGAAVLTVTRKRGEQNAP